MPLRPPPFFLVRPARAHSWRCKTSRKLITANEAKRNCNGRSGVTPEFPKGTYHYYATDSYPYLQRCVKGSLS